jgi:hypothetical protein
VHVVYLSTVFAGKIDIFMRPFPFSSSSQYRCRVSSPSFLRDPSSYLVVNHRATFLTNSKLLQCPRLYTEMSIQSTTTKTTTTITRVHGSQGSDETIPEDDWIQNMSKLKLEENSGTDEISSTASSESVMEECIVVPVPRRHSLWCYPLLRP